jgi:hypothetical protein
VTRVHTPGSADRLVIVFSDIEMGAGGRFDDFPRSDFLADVIRTYGRDPYRWLATHLVFNGDTFDLLKTSARGGYPHHVTREIAIDKMERVAAAHPAFFQAVGEFLADDERRTVSFVLGNHDMELLFPAVHAVIRERIGSAVADRVAFPGHSLSMGRMHIEHGSQLDALFRVDPTRPFIDQGGDKLLALPWATVVLLDVALPLQPLLYHHDRLKPKSLVLELIPEAKELLTSELWRYWTRQYFREVWEGSDPLKTISWSMLKEVVSRLVLTEIDVEMSDDLQRRMVDSDSFDLYLVGHQHEPGWWSHGRRKVLRTGCLRDEFMLYERGQVQVPINKTWAEVYMSGPDVVRSHLVEQPAPMRPKDTMPASVFDCVPELRRRIAALAAKPPEVEKAEQAEQEARERRQ